MELKNYFAQDEAGNILSLAECYLYERGTENLVPELLGVNGLPLSNPFFTDDQGLAQFAAPNGIYDLRVKKNARDFRVRVQCNDVSETMEVAEGAARALEYRLKDPSDPANGAAMLSWRDQSVGAYLDHNSVIFFGIPDASLDGLTGTDNYPALMHAIDRAVAEGRSRVIIPGYLGKSYLIRTPVTIPDKITLVGYGETSSKLVSPPVLNKDFISLDGNNSGLFDLGINCNCPTVDAVVTVGKSEEAKGYQNELFRVRVSGGRRCVSINEGLEARLTHCHLVKSLEEALYIARPDAICYNVSTDQSGTDGIRVNGHVATLMGCHPIRSGRHGIRLTAATASQLTDCQADTSGENGILIDASHGVTMVNCWAFKSGWAAPGTRRNFRFQDSQDLAVVTPFSNLDENCIESFGISNCSGTMYGPRSRGVRPMSTDGSLRVIEGVGDLSRHNDKPMSARGVTGSIAAGATYSTTVKIPAKFVNSESNSAVAVLKITSRNASSGSPTVGYGEAVVLYGMGSGVLPSSSAITWRHSNGVNSNKLTFSATQDLSSNTIGLMFNNTDTQNPCNVGFELEFMIPAKNW